MVQYPYKIKEELVVFLRNEDIISISDRGVNTQIDTGTFSATSNYTVAVNPTLIKNVRTITVAGSPLTRYTDYSVNYDTGVISFRNPQTGAYVIQYDEGSTDRNFPDFPQADLKLSAFPRIAVDIIGGDIMDIDLGASTTRHDYNITIICYSAEVEEMETMVTDVIRAMLINKKTFYYIKYMKTDILGPILNSPDKQNKIVSRSIDFVGKFNYETV